jgi:hypothetical protein
VGSPPRDKARDWPYAHSETIQTNPARTSTLSEQMKTKMKKISDETSPRKTDELDFDKWFEKQAYSFGAIPTWTQIEEMKRVWLIARKSLREKR